ncbi:MAG: hypothetical protein AAGB05_08850 [Pseudomonadota bacterium]
MSIDAVTLPWDAEALDHLRAVEARCATDLLETLGAKGRSGHPAVPYLESLTFRDPPGVVFVAAVAFEASVRLHLGRVAAADLRANGQHPILAPYLTQRAANPWEPAPQTPYTEVDWGRALKAARTTLPKDGFQITQDLPGARTLEETITRAGSHEAACALLFREPSADVVFDPVSSSALFLAEAMPCYADLDAALRAYRLAQLPSA